MWTVRLQNQKRIMFYTQFKPKKVQGESFTLPSCTVPDQSLTIPQIIARFVRTGSMPVSVHSDIGDNEAFEPEFEPLDLQPSEAIASLKPSKTAVDEPKDSEGSPVSPAAEKPVESPKNGE